MKHASAPRRPRAALVTALVAALVAALASCACARVTPDPEDATRARGAVPPGEDLAVLDSLAHLGYVDHAAPDAEPAAGVVLHVAGRAAPGFTLVTSLPNGRATLYDLEGRELRAWSDAERAGARWSRARILANGDVLALGPEADVLVRTTFDGTERWRRDLEVHHDGIELPDGRLLVLTRRFRVMPDVDPERRSVDNLLTFLSAEGEVLAEHSLYELLAAEPRVLTVVRPPGLENLPVGYNLDPIHANALHWLGADRPGAHPAFRAGRVLVTLRHLDSVAVLDLEAGRCVWAFGAGVLEGPHDASWLANGNVLLLDNGYDARGWSRVVELDPVRGEIVWEYRADVPGRFHTSGRGTVQALPNGNVLVGNSNSGEAFEIERAGTVVWRFLNPLVDERGARAVLRVERYAPELLAPFLAR